MATTSELDRLRQAQELLYEAISALAEGDWRTVGRSAKKAAAICDDVTRRAATRLAADREKS